jgi:hypothetical protein
MVGVARNPDLLSGADTTHPSGSIFLKTLTVSVVGLLQLADLGGSTLDPGFP